MAQKGRKAQRQKSASVQRYAYEQLAIVMAGAVLYLEDDAVEDIYLDVEHIDHSCGRPADHELKVVIRFAEGHGEADLWDDLELRAYLAARLDCLVETLTPRDGWDQTDMFDPKLEDEILYESHDEIARDLLADLPGGLTWAEVVGRPVAVPAHA